MSRTGKLRFDVDSALLFELGEQLVARKSIALAELVKNAYDADATQVVVSFHRVGRPGGSITVVDNGHGMTLRDIQEGWMRVATPRKARAPLSKVFKRPTTGSKGVGRFAARKIAAKLRLRSTALVGSVTREITEVTFDWKRYRPGKSLSSVTADYTVNRTRKEVPTGVSLELRGARDVWNASDIRAVRRDLQDLTPPFTAPTMQAVGDRTSNFEIVFEVPEHPDLEGSLSEDFLSAALARVEGHVARNGQPTYRLRTRSGQRLRFRPSEQFPEIGNAAFAVHYFRYERDSLVGSDVTVTQAREMGTRHGGVRIYQDGFRVFPYGDAGDDWLELDADRGRRLTAVDPLLRGLVDRDQIARPMLALPGNNNLFGAVFISRRDHPNLSPTINRERFVENDAFKQLERFVRLGIDWLVVARAREETKAKQSKTWTAAPTRKTQADDVSAAIARIRDALDELPDRDVAQGISGQLERLGRAIEEQTEAGLDKIAVLRILASAGTMVVIFTHQMRSILDGIRRIATDMGEVGEALPGAFAEDIDATRASLKSWTSMMDAQAAQLGLLLAPDARRDARSFVLRPVVDQVFATLAPYAAERGIDLRNSVPPAVRTPPMFEAELHSILLNVLTNAVKAVREQAERVIEVAVERTTSAIRIHIRDTGGGIAARDRDRVFEPFVTTSAPDPVLGAGTGIGLAIVRDIAADNGGSARFIDPPQGWKTNLMVELPKAVAR